MNHAISDEEAIARIRGGDIASYEILATRHHRALYKVARRFLDSEADAEDAVQGAHLLALTHFGQYAGRCSFVGWMSAITRNEAFTQMRRRQSVVATDEEALDSMPSKLRGPEEQVLDRDFDDMLSGALASLPSAYRSVFRLREVERVSTAEAGQQLGLTGACVKTRLRRARILLRKALADRLGRADLSACEQ
jgi:RNA polymerase sigma-70 factor, ECF subfamily